MFTGIVEEIGTITQCEKRYPVQRLTIEGSRTVAGSAIGDSMSVDGVCLTIVEVKDNVCVVDVQEETLLRTTIGQYRVGTRVNLERALTPSTRMGGHYVQGHVDGLAIVRVWRQVGADWVLRIAVEDTALHRYIVPKGFIAINGISLTVASCDETYAVHVIPHTRKMTTLHTLRVGMHVNVEVDILAKYVESCMRASGVYDINR